MSIQTKKFISKKTGKTTIKYYAVVFSAIRHKNIWSKGYLSKKGAKLAELKLINSMENNTYIFD